MVDKVDPRALKVQELLMDEFIDILENGLEHVTKEGDVIRIRPTPAALSVIRQFLKDNNIQAVLATDDEFIKSVTKDLPDFGADDDSTYYGTTQ